MTALSPLVSEFDTVEQETAYVAWLRKQVKTSLDDPRPSIPHAEVMADIDAIIDAARDARTPLAS